MNLGALLGILRGTQRVRNSKSIQDRVAKTLVPFAKKSPSSEPLPGIPIRAAKSAGGLLMFVIIGLLTWQLYDMNIMFRDWYYYKENSFFFPGESMIFHLFTGFPFIIIRFMFLVYTLLIIFKPVGIAYFISDLIDAEQLTKYGL